MTIYEPTATNGYEWLRCEDARDWDAFRRLDGQPRASEWRPVRVNYLRKDGRMLLSPSDFPWLNSSALVMRLSAVVALREMLDACGEILRLRPPDGAELFVFNSKRLDAMDRSRSEIGYVPNTDKIIAVKLISFISSAIRGVDIFRLPNRGSRTYVSERFVEHVDRAGLKGLDFTPVWAAPN